MTLDPKEWGAQRSAANLMTHGSVVVFGASPAAAEVVNFLSGHGLSIAAYADNSEAKQRTGYAGREVWPAARAAGFARNGGAIVIASAYQREIAAQLIDAFDAPSSAIYPYVSAMFAGHFGQAAIEPFLDRIKKLIAILADEDSRVYVRDLVKFRWTMSPMDVPRNKCIEGFYDYRAAGLGPHPGAHIVDCGAFTGDTAEAYMARLGGDATMTAIEPMPENFRRLVETIRTQNWGDRVTPVNAAVGCTEGQIEISGDEGAPDPRATAARSNAAKRETVRLTTIDKIFAGRTGDVGFVKIDIEGAELDALDGARNVIRHAKPQLAIAGYHKAPHLWEIPERILAMDDGYAIYAGHHPSAAYEVEFFCAHRGRAARAA